MTFTYSLILHAFIVTVLGMDGEKERDPGRGEAQSIRKRKALGMERGRDMKRHKDLCGLCMILGGMRLGWPDLIVNRTIIAFLSHLAVEHEQTSITLFIVACLGRVGSCRTGWHLDDARARP